jgi:glycosyltransferase involved in cell wall biosynthesis
VLYGLIKPDAGQVRIQGRVSALIELGTGFNPVLSGREIVYVNAAICGLPRRVAEIQSVEYYHQNNRGQGAARNFGVGLAQGEYIASLDSDDLWESDSLARSVSCLEAFTSILFSPIGKRCDKVNCIRASGCDMASGSAVGLIATETGSS